jgi:hypothetical protein
MLRQSRLTSRATTARRSRTEASATWSLLEVSTTCDGRDTAAQSDAADALPTRRQITKGQASEPACRPLAPWAATYPRPPSARQRRSRARRTRDARAHEPRRYLALSARAARRRRSTPPAGNLGRCRTRFPICGRPTRTTRGREVPPSLARPCDTSTATGPHGLCGAAGRRQLDHSLLALPPPAVIHLTVILALPALVCLLPARSLAVTV